MDRMKEYGIITVIAVIAIIAAIYIQYQGSDDQGNGEKLEAGDYILKSSFEVGDYYSSHYSNKDKGDAYTIIGIDPKDPSRYDVQKNDSIRPMTYDDFKSMLAPDLEELKKEATSFTDRGIETLDTCVGKAKCHTYDAEFALQGGGSYHRIYYMTDSGVLFKTVNIHPTGEYVYSGIDSTSMVTDTVYPDPDAKKVKGDAGYTEYTVKDSFDVGDSHMMYDVDKVVYDVFLISAKDPKDPKKYTVLRNDVESTMSYDEIRQLIAPDLVKLSDGTVSFGKSGSTTFADGKFGAVKCDIYAAAYMEGEEVSQVTDYYISGSGVLVKVEGIMSNGLSQYCNTIDKSTMVMVPGTGS